MAGKNKSGGSVVTQTGGAHRVSATGEATRRDRTDPAQATYRLQRAAGNRALSGMLQSLSRGNGLPAVTTVEGPQTDLFLNGVRARAAARGNEILAGRGAFEGNEGFRRLAHEFAHILQQRAQGLPAGNRLELEADADRFAEAHIRGEQARVHYGSQPEWLFDDADKKVPDVSSQFKYQTRNVGNDTVKTVSGRLWKPGTVKTHRAPGEQRSVSSGTGEDAGHLVGNRFGAAGDERNLSRQNWKANRFGTFKDLENKWAAKLSQGFSIIVSVSDYTRKGEDRPYKREVVWTEVTADGQKQDFKLTYANFETPESRRAKANQAAKEPAKKEQEKKTEQKKVDDEALSNPGAGVDFPLVPFKVGAANENAFGQPPGAAAQQAEEVTKLRIAQPKLRFADPKLRFEEPPTRVRIGPENLGAGETEALAVEEMAGAAKTLTPPSRMNFGAGEAGLAVPEALVVMVIIMLIGELIETDQQKADREKLRGAGPEIQKRLMPRMPTAKKLEEDSLGKTVYANITLKVAYAAPPLMSDPGAKGPIKEVTVEDVKVSLKKDEGIEFVSSQLGGFFEGMAVTHRVKYSVWIAGEDPWAGAKALAKRVNEATSNKNIADKMYDLFHPERVAERKKLQKELEAQKRKSGVSVDTDRMKQMIWGTRAPKTTQKKQNEP